VNPVMTLPSPGAGAIDHVVGGVADRHAANAGQPPCRRFVLM
jgi:hypothetical protein